MICWFAGQPTIFMYIHTSTGEKTVYWVVIRQIGGLFNQHNATNSKSFTGQLLYLLDYRAYTWQITAKSRTNVHLADNNNYRWESGVKLLHDWKYSSKRSEFLGFYCYLCHVISGFCLFLICNTKIGEISDMTKSWATFCCSGA